MGSGRFAQQLTYAEWLAFNNAQRGHQNMLETLPSFYATLFGAGAFHPKLAAWRAPVPRCACACRCAAGLPG